MYKFNCTMFNGDWKVDPIHSDGKITLANLKSSVIRLNKDFKTRIGAKFIPNCIITVKDEDLVEVAGDKKNTFSYFVKSSNYEIKVGDISLPESDNSNMSIIDRIHSNPAMACPTPDKDGWYVDPDTWDFLMASYLTGQHILLRGDTGSGKTELIRLIASRLNLDLDIIDMSILDGRTTLCGSTKLLNGNTIIKPARFAESVAKESFILLDELSRADAMANNVLLPVLDSRRTLHMEELGDIENVKRHDKCVIWATANIGIEYTGTGNIDEAISNRFVQVNLNYAPIDAETEILINRTGIGRKDAKQLASMADVSRTNSQITHPISTRQLLTIAEYVSMGFKTDQATRQCLGAIYSGRGDNSLDLLTSGLR